jgi:predicted short-subunit dehydrogenase-like oxidoreductase (DUF2520 family)
MASMAALIYSISFFIDIYYASFIAPPGESAQYIAHFPIFTYDSHDDEPERLSEGTMFIKGDSCGDAFLVDISVMIRDSL